MDTDRPTLTCRQALRLAREDLRAVRDHVLALELGDDRLADLLELTLHDLNEVAHRLPADP